MEGIVRLHEKIKAGVPPAYQIRGVSGRARPMATRRSRGSSRRSRRTARRRSSSIAARLVEACTHLRDEQGFNFLSDVTPTDYLGWGGRGVAGYIGTAAGRDLQRTRLAGASHACPIRSRSASRSTTTCCGSPTTRARVRVQVWLDDGEEIDTRDPASGRRPTGSSARPGTCSASSSAAIRTSSGS